MSKRNPNLEENPMSPKLSLIPLTVALLFTSLPAFAQQDPRAWENSLTQQIYADVHSGRTTAQQGQNRINEVQQIQQEHQQYLNVNGTPTGNLLTPQQRSQIQQQLAEVDRERRQDVANYGARQPFNNSNQHHDWGHHWGNANYNGNYNNGNYNNANYNANYNNGHYNIQQPQQGGYGNWGYKHHWWDK
jgi:hypothetical protein